MARHEDPKWGDPAYLHTLREDFIARGILTGTDDEMIFEQLIREMKDADPKVLEEPTLSDIEANLTTGSTYNSEDGKMETWYQFNSGLVFSTEGH